MIHAFTIRVATCLLASALASETSSQDAPDGFYVPPGLRPSLQSVRKNGIGDLMYEVAEPYPAGRFISDLQQILSKRRWTVPQRDPLNPGLSTDLNWAKWQESGKPHPVEGVYIRDWQCEWLSERGDLVRYVLRYRRASPSDAWSPLQVAAVYWPAAVVSAEKARLNALKPR